MERKVLLTYKRKRFFSRANLAHDGTDANSSPDVVKGLSSGILSPKAEPDIDDKKLNGENMDIPLEKVKYIKRHVPEDSLQKPFPEKTRRKSSSDISEMGSMKLRSQKVLSSRKTAEDGFRNLNLSGTTADVDISMDFSCNDSGTQCKVPCLEGSSSSRLADLDNIRQSIPEFLNSAPEKKGSSGCPQNLTSEASGSDNVFLNKELPKENCNTPLKTFYRRTKKKQFISATSVERNLKSDEKKCSIVNCNSHALQASCQPKDSTQKISLKDLSTTAAVSQDQIDLNAQNKHEQVVMTDANIVTSPESAPKGSIPETRIGGCSSEVSPVHSGPKSCHVNRVLEEPLNKCLEAARNENEDSVLLHKNKQLDLAKNATAERAQLKSNLTGDVNNSRKMNLQYCISERLPLSDLNLPVVPPSSANSSNVGRCKFSVDAVAGTLLESQSSSTPGYEITLDEEADGRGKELEWLDSLDKDLQQSKSERNILSSGEQVNTNYGQASRGRASPIIAGKSSAGTPCNQDLTREYTNVPIPLRERLILSRPRETGSDKRQHEETSNEAPLCTNLLVSSLHLSSKLPVHSNKGFQNMLSQSNLGFNYSGHLHEGQLPWRAAGQNSSLIRSKQMVGDISGTGIVKERRGSWLDKYQRNSNEWSEEELDFLWIGVRRHGMFNWNAMLTDPRLRFLESRVPEDLAKRWDLEQRKLLNGALLPPPVSLSRPVVSSSSMLTDAFLAKPADAHHYGNYNARPQFPVTQAETRLSLGNAYIQKDNISKSNIFHPSSVGMNDVLTSTTPSTVTLTSSLPMGPTSQMTGTRQQKLMRNGNTMCDRDSYHHKSGESSIRELQSSSVQISSSLPHWLKGALQNAPVQNLPVSHVSTVSHVADLHNNDLQAAPSFPNIGESSATSRETRGRGILKRKSPVSANNVGSLRVSDTKSSYLPLPLCVTSKRPASDGLNPDRRNNMCDLNKISDLVVVDGDASSEETISDDQSRP